MTTREACGFKAGVDGIRNRHMTVSAVVADSQPVVHLRLRDGSGSIKGATDTIDLTLRQANTLVKALNAAIEAAEIDPRCDARPFHEERSDHRSVGDSPVLR